MALPVLLGLGGTVPSRLAATETHFIDYLYVEANEGGSSGGHVALRFGADVFHFQQEGAGLIRMRRDDAGAFAFRYAMLGNRPIHETRVAVSADTEALLHATFTRRLLIQAAQYEHLDALAADVTLFAEWPRLGTVAATFPVRAAGYFLPDGAAAGEVLASRSPALVALRAHIAEAAGADFVRHRAAALRAMLAAWQPHAVRAAAPLLARDSYPVLDPTASTAYAEQLEGLTALEVVDAAPALRPDTYRIADAMPGLDAGERETLAAFARELRASLVALAASPRADFGYPLLLGMARLAAIEASLADGHLVVLDAFAANAPIAPLPDGPTRSAMLDALAAQLRPVVERARQELLGAQRFSEADYTQLETTVNRLLEVEGARRDGAPLRSEPGLLLPVRPAGRRERIAQPLPETAARVELEAARAAVADYHSRLAALYRYNLLTQNCVSEIFATVDAALGDSAGAADDAVAVADESRQRLGGVVRMDSTLNFIPIVSSGAVARNYATVAERTRRSYRQLRLAALAREESAWRVALRESNTLTATAYHAGPADSPFLFFTDDAGLAALVVRRCQSAGRPRRRPASRGLSTMACACGPVCAGRFTPELAFVNRGSTALNRMAATRTNSRRLVLAAPRSRSSVAGARRRQDGGAGPLLDLDAFLLTGSSGPAPRRASRHASIVSARR
jgi:hypothetical protein